MADIKNLFINTDNQQPNVFKLPRNVIFNKRRGKQFFVNGHLVWKNAEPFIFVSNVASLNLSDLASGTLIFENFSSNDFNGTYNTITNIEEKPSILGQMVVIETTEGD